MEAEWSPLSPLAVLDQEWILEVYVALRILLGT